MLQFAVIFFGLLARPVGGHRNSGVHGIHWGVHTSAIRHDAHSALALPAVLHVQWIASQRLPVVEVAVFAQLRVRTHDHLFQFKEGWYYG